MLAVLSGLLASGAVAADTAGEAPDDSWIVVLRDGVAPGQAAEALASVAGGEVGHVYEHVLGGFSLTASPEAAAALANNPLVDRVEADQTVEALANIPTGVSRVDAAHDDPYGGPSNREPAHDAGYLGAGTSIAILDTGIYSRHPDLNVDTSLGKACIGHTTEDVHGHGTHVAGTAAAQGGDDGIVGVAPASTLIPVKVLDDSGFGTWSSVMCGIEHVTELNEEGTADGPLVANMSLGGAYTGSPEQNALLDALADSVAAGVTHAVAAGNSSADADGFVPARSEEAITVSALADLDGIPGGLGGCQHGYCDDTFADFSNFGEVIDLIAPGVLIESTLPGGGYGTFSGTSMASPHVAGVAALVLAEDDSLEPDDVRLLLQATGECPDESWNNGGPTCDDDQGQWDGDPDGIAEPLVNAFRAADAAHDDPDFMFVRLAGEPVLVSPDTWVARMIVYVYDEDGERIEGADVTGRWESAHGQSKSACTTQDDGSCSMLSHRLDRERESEVTFTLGRVRHPDYVLHPDHEGMTATVTLQ